MRNRGTKERTVQDLEFIKLLMTMTTGSGRSKEVYTIVLKSK